MPNITEQGPIARKLLPIIYVLDTSGSMEGDRIAAVNSAMHETMEVLKDVSNNNPTAELKIGVLQFASGAKWITDTGFVFMEDFFWNDLGTGGLTDFGSALNELNNKLSRSGYLESEVGYKVPVIIFMSDGQPTDDYKTALAKISASNKWFKAATKIAIAIGEDADIGVLEEIVGSNEAVIKAEDLVTLKKLIKVVSVTASMIGSRSKTDSNSTSEIITTVNHEIGGGTQPAGGGTGSPQQPDPDPDPDPWPALPGGSGNPWGNDVWD